MKYFYIILITGLLFSSCTNKLEEINALTQTKEYPDITMVNLETTFSKNANIEAKFFGSLVYKYTNKEEPYLEFPNGILLMTYDKDSVVKSTLKADYAIYYDKKKLARVEKNVKLTNSSGDMLQAEYLFLDEKKEKIYSDKPVKFSQINGSGMTAKESFESDLEFRIYKFKGVEGVENVKDFFDKEEENQKIDK